VRVDPHYVGGYKTAYAGPSNVENVSSS